MLCASGTTHEYKRIGRVKGRWIVTIEHALCLRRTGEEGGDHDDVKLQAISRRV